MVNPDTRIVRSSEPMLLVGKSKIQGKGLFTDTAIRKRKKVGEFTGEMISVREARKRAKNASRIAIVEISETKAIDAGVAGGGLFQYVNHSCDPNLYIRIAYGRVEFYTRKQVRAGDELTCDYEDSHHEGRLPCGCKSPKCRKFI